MCYGATGKIMISEINNEIEHLLLRRFAEFYAMKELDPFKRLPIAVNAAIFALTTGFVRYDDIYDLQVISYGYKNF